MRPKNLCPRCKGPANMVTVEEKRRRAYLLSPGYQLNEVMGNIACGILHADDLLQTSRGRYFTCGHCGHSWREF